MNKAEYQNKKNTTDNSLLLILPVFLFRHEGQVWLDEQAWNGLRLWLENFETLTVAAVLNPEFHGTDGSLCIDTLPYRERMDVITLPFAYTPLAFVKEYRKTMQKIESLVDEHRFLSFAIGGFWGDWGSFACFLAFRKKRTFSVWTDRVEHDILLLWSKNKKGFKKNYYYILAKLSGILNGNAISKATLGLFHGNDCFETYSPLLETSFCVHDIHLSSDYQITYEELEDKIAGIDQERPVRLFYAGRVDAMKGPHDWLQVMKNLLIDGYSIEAQWAGEGELKDKITRQLQSEELEDRIRFIGLVSNRDELLEVMKSSDLFVFCHKTQESPRCLIEALISGCPIVGYRSAYPEGLVSQFGGGWFVEKNNVTELSDCIKTIVNDKMLMKRMVRDAAKSGRLYSDSAVFKHRSDLIKKYS